MRKMAIASVVVLWAFVSLGAAAGASKGVSPKVRHWYLHEGGKHYFSLLTRDLHKVDRDFHTLASESSQAAAMSEAGVLGKACRATSSDLVEVGLQLAPVPDKALERRWSKALKDLTKGSANCTAGTAALSSSELNKAGSQFNAAIDLFKTLNF